MALSRFARVFGLVFLAGIGLSACDALLESSSETRTSPVKVQLRSVTSDQPASAGKQQNQLADGELVVEGDNGTLTITDLRFVLSKLEIEGEGSEDDDNLENDDEGEDEDDDNDENNQEEWNGSGELKAEDGEFKLTDTFIDVPLDLNQEQVLAALGDLQIVEGSYDKLEFKIEEPEFDDDESGNLLEQIRTEFPDWPEEASLMAVGTFTPTGGDPQPFTVFFDAEVKIEHELDPPLTVSGDETPTITIDLDPSRIFQRYDGTVRDLSQYDYSSYGDLVEFELEIEDSFQKVEMEYGD